MTKDIVLNIISHGYMITSYIEKYDLSYGDLEVLFSIIASIP